MEENDVLSFDLDRLEREYFKKYGRVFTLDNNKIKKSIYSFVSQMNNIFCCIENNSFSRDLKKINIDFAQFYNVYFNDLFIPQKIRKTKLSNNLYKVYFSNILNLVGIAKNCDGTLCLSVLDFLERYLELFCKFFLDK